MHGAAFTAFQTLRDLWTRRSKIIIRTQIFVKMQQIERESRLGRLLSFPYHQYSNFYSKNLF